MYHYAGNNPVKYTDPTGMFDFDEENKTIHCDLSNYEDLTLAATQFVLNEGRGYNKCVATDPKTGNSITFNNAEAMLDFTGQLDKTIDFEGMLNELSQTTTLAYIVADGVPLGDLAKGVKNLSFHLSLLTTFVDGYQLATNPNLDTISDIVIDAVGFCGVPGAIVSIGLSYTKKGTVFAATEMAKFSIELENWSVNQFCDMMFGINFKR